VTEINRTEPPYLQITRHYRELIERGELHPGEPYRQSEPSLHSGRSRRPPPTARFKPSAPRG
jgi:hypothetical protein